MQQKQTLTNYDRTSQSDEPPIKVRNEYLVSMCALDWPTERDTKLALLALEPHQPTHLPFSADIYKLKETDGSVIQRKWLTFVDKRLYCTVCGCFSSERQNEFVLGIGEGNFCRASQLVKRHEVTELHKDASDMYFQHLCVRDIRSFIQFWKSSKE